MPAASFRPDDGIARGALARPGRAHDHVAAQGSRAGAHPFQRLHEAAALFALREQNAVLAPHRRDLEPAPAHEIEHLRVAHAGVVTALEIRVAQLDAVPSRVLDGAEQRREAAWCRASRYAAPAGLASWSRYLLVKSFTAKDAEGAKEEKSLTAKDAKDAKETTLETSTEGRKDNAKGGNGMQFRDIVRGIFPILQTLFETILGVTFASFGVINFLSRPWRPSR